MSITRLPDLPFFLLVAVTIGTVCARSGRRLHVRRRGHGPLRGRDLAPRDARRRAGPIPALAAPFAPL